RRHTRFSRDWSSDVCSSDLALVDRVKELSPLLRDIHQPVLEITAAINDVKARIDEIDAELLDRSVSAAAKLLADVEEPVGTAERSEERRVGKERGAGRARAQ